VLLACQFLESPGAPFSCENLIRHMIEGV
jgi:hypothetical protein